MDIKSFVFVVSALSLPILAQAYQMPLKAEDLKPGERYSTAKHAAGISGIQAQGWDIGALRHVSDDNWHRLKTAGADSKQLANWIVYGKPFYAMASGTVVGCWRNAPENIPGGEHPDLAKKKFARGGNHLWILQDDGVYALYAHAQPGSIPSSLCPHNAQLFSDTAAEFKRHPDIDPSVAVNRGARVAAGQLLGRIGNSGASSGPHLHVHMEKDGKAVPIPFDRGMSARFSIRNTAKLDGPWTHTAGKPLPQADILIWPPRSIGNYTFKGTKGADYQRVFMHMADSGMMPNLVTCQNNGATYNSDWIPSQGQWISHHGMTADDAKNKHALYTSQGYKRTSSYTCGSRSVAVWRK